METFDPSWLPPLLELSQHSGDWSHYCEALYATFARDFLSTRPSFQSLDVSAPRRGSKEGEKNGTFWHIVSDGTPQTSENDRIPNLRRAERIEWIRRVIENEGNPTRVVSWQNDDRGDRRWVLSLPDFSYKVVLADHGRYMTLITGFPVEHEHQRHKTRKEYERASAAHRMSTAPKK